MSYLCTDNLSVDWSRPDREGSFGRVFFGDEITTNTPVVVKCPVETPKARLLYDVEEHVNEKLASLSAPRVAEFLGRIIVPRGAELVPGVARIGLVWARAGAGETLEDYFNDNRVAELGAVLGVQQAYAGRLRVSLAESVLVELVELLRVLDEAGIVHRDIKPDNIVIDASGDAPPLRCIDFGSSCDWGRGGLESLFKKGLNTDTCDPVYSAPEKRIDKRAAKTYDVYSVGLIVLRCLWPSLTTRREMAAFVKKDLLKYGTFDRFLTAASSGQAGTAGGTRADAMVLDREKQLAPLRSLLSTMLEVNPRDRADGMLGWNTFLCGEV